MIKRIISAFMCLTMAFMFMTVCPDICVIDAEAADDPDTPYYYSQMSEEAQKAYTELKAAALGFKKKVTVNVSIDQEDFDMIAEMLILHDPVTFNIFSIEAANVTRRSADFIIEYKYTKETYDDMTAAYEKRVDKILDLLTEDMSKYKKIRVIHDELIRIAEYDLESRSNDNIYGTLVKKKAKCDGYAKTFAYLCAKAGIRTVTVIGEVSDNNTDEMHMWNKVYFNGQWYNVDVTWDDPVGNMKDNLKHDYFMISDEEIGKDHTEDNISFTVPAAEDDTIGYYEVNKKYAEKTGDIKDIIKKCAVSAAKNKKAVLEFQCASKEVFEQAKKYVLDAEEMNSILKSVKKSTGADLLTEIYSYSFGENLYTVKIMMFYSGTSIDYYFNGDDPISGDMKNALAKFGIE